MKSMSRGSLCTNFRSKNYALCFCIYTKTFFNFLCEQLCTLQIPPACSDSLCKIKLRMRMKKKHDIRGHGNFSVRGRGPKKFWGGGGGGSKCSKYYP